MRIGFVCNDCATEDPQPGAQEVQAAVISSFMPLVGGGGRASAPGAQTTVKCAVVHASAPVVVPETGGF